MPKGKKHRKHHHRKLQWYEGAREPFQTDKLPVVTSGRRREIEEGWLAKGLLPEEEGFILGDNLCRGLSHRELVQELHAGGLGFGHRHTRKHIGGISSRYETCRNFSGGEAIIIFDRAAMQEANPGLREVCYGVEKSEVMRRMGTGEHFLAECEWLTDQGKIVYPGRGMKVNVFVGSEQLGECTEYYNVKDKRTGTIKPVLERPYGELPYYDDNQIMDQYVEYFLKPKFRDIPSPPEEVAVYDCTQRKHWKDEYSTEKCKLHSKFKP